jgi:hypothetical protein
MTTTRRRRTRPTETPQFAAVVARMIRAHGRRVADADPIDLAELLALRDVLDAAIDEAGKAQRARFSLGEIAEGLGVSKQYVSKRWQL